jgi:hypothetical protein
VRKTFEDGKQHFLTLDSLLTAFLVYCNHDFQLRESNGKILFDFVVNNQLQKDLNAFSENAQVGVADYVACVKQTSGRLREALRKMREGSP